MTGTTAYCLGAAATPNTLTYGQCTLGGGIIDAGVAYSAQWYYNTTGGTSIPGSTALGAPITGTSPAGGSGVVNYTPVTTAVGTFYYFCYVTWTTTGTCTTDFTSNTQTITISAAPAAITGTPTVCIGSTTTLATTATGGAWSSSNPGIATVAGGVVSGVSAGVCTISYTVSGCSAVQSVTVFATPAAITPATAVTLCQGATATLACATGGGTWSSSATGIATVSSGGVVTGIAGGTATITYSIGTGGCFATKNVTVQPIPLPITGTTQVCPGATTPLFSASPGGTWSSDAPSIASINATTGVVSGIAAGTTTISYTGCGSVTTVVSVHALPATITGGLFVCEGGGTTTLSSATTGGTWSSSTPTRATASTSGPSTGTVTGVSVGTSTITYTSTLGCIRTAEVTVKPIPAAILGSVPVCVGQSMTLTNAIPGGTWNSAVPGIAAVSPTGLVTGLTAGTTMISYQNDCNYATVIVTINALPNAIDGRDTLCEGSITVLANSTLGGTWQSSNPAVASILLTSGLISGHASGFSIITYTMPGGCYTTKTVTVIPQPNAITGPMEVCPDKTITLSNTTAGGIWISTHPAAATVNPVTGVVTGIAASTALITYTTGAGCVATAVVTVNEQPAPIVGDVIYCASDIDTLYNPTPGGLWSSTTPGIATIGATTGIVTVINGGTAVIRYTLPTGCFASKSFTVRPGPVPVVTYKAETNTFYTEDIYNTYQWYDSLQGLIPGATTYRTAAIYYGYYFVVVTDSNGCSAKSANHIYNQYTSVNDVASEGQFSVFPNPSQDMIFIESPVVVKAVVSTIDGKQLITQPNASKINISQLAAGMYLITLYDNEGIQRSVHKIVKQ